MSAAQPEPLEPPFMGLQRNALALILGGLLVAGIAWLLPDLSPTPTQPPAVALFRGHIVEFLHSDDVTAPDVRLKIIDGPRAGDLIDGYLQGPSGQEELPRYQIGDDVVISGSLEPDDTYWAVSDLYRIPVLALLLGIFAVSVTVVGGWRGVRSLLALALTLVVIVRIVVPLILAGYDPLWVAIVAATGVTIVTFVLTEGLRPQTIAAAIGTFASLALVAGLAIVFDELARFTTLRGSEDASYLQAVGVGQIDIGGLILAAIIFGALGILDDVTVTQAATVTELHEADPSAGRAVLAGRAMNVGRSHIAATVNTLVLAYVGASLPLIVLFAAGRQDPFLTASSEVVAVEVVRALAGSIGIVAAVPLTTAIAAFLVGRKLPFMPSPEMPIRAPGWE